MIFTHILRRRKTLTKLKSGLTATIDLSESCVLSYTHPNIFAAAVAWYRLTTVSSYLKNILRHYSLLDFGAGTGELAHLIPPAANYYYCEQESVLAQFIKRDNANAIRVTDIQALTSESFDVITCLDSLEHNTEISQIIEGLVALLKPGGRLIVSGPTENAIYKLGRRIAGFSGDYHHTNIYEIERLVECHLNIKSKRYVPFGMPLFSISIWEKTIDTRFTS